MNRRHYLLTPILAVLFALFANGEAKPGAKTNFVLCMTDDQGWGDAGYLGHPQIKTPVIDEMAASGLRFDRFYAPAPVCSPSRGGFMTGRSPSRYGCYSYGFILRGEEVTLGEMARTAGYATAHYGKWHLGPVLKDHPLAPPAQGFDDSLAHDNFFDLNPKLSRNGEPPQMIKGESSDILAAETVRFMRECKSKDRPFLIVVWFPSPHEPYAASAADAALYPNATGKAKAYYGEISGIDRAMGTIRSELRKLAIEKDTFLLFTSDNGATGEGSAGNLTGKKMTFNEGGIRVPGIIEWPAHIPKPRHTSIPCGSIDLFPTVREIIGADSAASDRPLDGVSILPLIDDKWTSRPKPMGFGVVKAGSVKDDGKWFHGFTAAGTERAFKGQSHSNPPASYPGTNGVWIDNDFKLLDGKLYNLKDDQLETKNLAADLPDRLKAMEKALGEWQTSVARSLCGLDYK